MTDQHVKPLSPGGLAASAGTSPIAPGLPPERATMHPPPGGGPGAKKPAHDYKDGTREIVETVVFVVVLVLLLKTFLAEAFVIPTGSMATTLLGYHKQVTCDQCRRPFLVNVSQEVDPDPPNVKMHIDGGHCPNCGLYNRFLLPQREEQP